MSITQNDITLIIGYLESNNSPEQQNDFFSWLEKDRENEKLFFEIKRIYQSNEDNIKDFNVNESWVRMQHKIEEKIKTGEKIRSIRSLYKKLYPLAAAVLALFVVSSVYFFINRDSRAGAQTYVFNNQIGQSALHLPDGTLVELASNSTFEYDSDFGKKNRTVKLNGEAFFEVAADKNKPFIVQSGIQQIEVLGTKFNVQAYAIDSVYTTSLMEGAIRLSWGDKSFDLSPGKQVIFHAVNGNMDVRDINEKETVSWLSGYYVFNKKTLAFILNRMGKVYDVNFIADSAEVEKQILSGTFYQGQDLKDFLKVLELATGLNYQINDKDVLIYKKSQRKSN